MKYIGLRNQLLALKAQLPQRGIKIVITGGVPDDLAAQPEPPGGIDLKHQHRAFARPTSSANMPTPT
jgi:hypothetical protein